MHPAVSNGSYDVAKIRADFPALAMKVYGKPLVYLDNAASAQKPKAVLGGHSPGAGMRGGEQAQMLEVGKDRTDRGGRQVESAGRQRLRAHGLAGGDVAFHHQAKDLASAAGQFGNRGRGHRGQFKR